MINRLIFAAIFGALAGGAQALMWSRMLPRPLAFVMSAIGGIACGLAAAYIVYKYEERS
jgi:hypothetical protein